jgi:5'-nucleotidase
MRNLTVLCDLDAIAADLLGPWLAAYNQAYNDDLTAEEITDYEIHKFTKPECGFKIYEFIELGEVYRNLQPLPGAIQGIQAIEADGHDVIIVSAGSKNLATAGHKLEWCKTFLGFDRKKCIIAHRKELIRGDVFIDDSPPNIRKYREAWPHTPIFTIAYPYNKEVENLCLRFPDHRDTVMAWSGIVENVKYVARNF